MLKKFLKEIVVSIAGKSAEEIVDLLDGKKYINEFIIAKKLNLTINQTRNILYKISDQGLVSFIRKKDKRKGWYTYFWKIEIMKSLEFLKGSIMKKIEQVNHQIKSRETKEFYVCETCNIEFSEESALVHNFVCNECGNIVARKDNNSTIKEYNKELERLKRELESVEEEYKVEKEKVDKIKARDMKKEEKLKKEETEKRKKEKKKNKQPLKKKEAVKKKVNKKKEKKKIKKRK
jgi:transcription factor E